MKIWKEFKEFAFKGNVVDLAVGVMIGSAFTGIVTSVVKDLFTPLFSVATQGVDFTTMGVKLGEGEDAAVFAYGNFIQAVINFFLVAICIFLLVKFINRLRRKPEAAPAKPTRKCPFCFSEIDEKATRCPHCTSMLDAHE
jgi:large conductance mechanosensitive channel